MSDEVVLITGCSSGIGLALAKEYQSKGCRTFASARRPESLKELEGLGLETAKIDVSDVASIQSGVASVVERAGRLDVLVNNAGINLFGPLAEVPLESFRRMFETNVTGLLATIQAAFPTMADQRSGKIVNVGSVVGIMPTPFAGPYCSTKSAVHMLSDVLRMEVEPFGITVTVVQPGGVRSNISKAGSAGLDRYASEASRYHRVYDGIVKRANASQDNPMEAEDFARELVAQVMVEPPPRLVRLGTGADVIPKMAELPGEQRDQMMRAQFGLGALGES